MCSVHRCYRALPIMKKIGLGSFGVLSLRFVSMFLSRSRSWRLLKPSSSSPSPLDARCSITGHTTYDLMTEYGREGRYLTPVVYSLCKFILSGVGDDKPYIIYREAIDTHTTYYLCYKTSSFVIWHPGPLHLYSTHKNLRVRGSTHSAERLAAWRWGRTTSGQNDGGQMPGECSRMRMQRAALLQPRRCAPQACPYTSHASHPKPHTYATPHIRITSPTAHTYLMHTILRYVCTCI